MLTAKHSAMAIRVSLLGYPVLGACCSLLLWHQYQPCDTGLRDVLLDTGKNLYFGYTKYGNFAFGTRSYGVLI